MNKKVKSDLKTNILVMIAGIMCGVIKYKMGSLISIIILLILVSIIYSEDNIGNVMIATLISIILNYILEITAIMICFAIKKIVNFLLF